MSPLVLALSISTIMANLGYMLRFEPTIMANLGYMLIFDSCFCLGLLNQDSTSGVSGLIAKQLDPPSAATGCW